MTRAAIANPRRAFVMPVVILLMVVVGLTISLILTRNNTELKLMSRQVDAYGQHHTGRGLQQAIGAWLRQQNGRDLADLLRSSGSHAMDIVLEDGSVVSVSMIDAQGMLRSQAATLDENDREPAEQALTELLARVGRDRFPEFTRPIGPVGVSAETAPMEVLEAVAEVVSPGNALRLSRELEGLQKRDDPIERQDLVALATQEGLSSEERALLIRLVNTDVELWGVLVEVRGGRGLSRGRLLARYGGVTLIRSSSRRTASSNPLQIGSFLTWKDLGIESGRVRVADLYGVR